MNVLRFVRKNQLLLVCTEVHLTLRCPRRRFRVLPECHARGINRVAANRWQNFGKRTIRRSAAIDSFVENCRDLAGATTRTGDLRVNQTKAEVESRGEPTGSPQDILPDTLQTEMPKRQRAYLGLHRRLRHGQVLMQLLV